METKQCLYSVCCHVNLLALGMLSLSCLFISMLTIAIQYPRIISHWEDLNIQIMNRLAYISRVDVTMETQLMYTVEINTTCWFRCAHASGREASDHIRKWHIKVFLVHRMSLFSYCVMCSDECMYREQYTTDFVDINTLLWAIEMDIYTPCPEMLQHAKPRSEKFRWNLMFKMYVLLQEFTGFNHLKLAAICSHVQLQFLYFTLGNVYVQHIRKTTGNDSLGNNMFCLSWICLFKQVVEHMCDYL